MKLRLARPAREAIGMRLRELRRFHTLEQTKLAQMAGLSQAIISQYEKGMTEVSLAFITFLTQRFGISTEWLISGYGPSSPDGKKEEPPGASAEASAASKGKRKSARYTEVPLVDPHVAAVFAEQHGDGRRVGFEVSHLFLTIIVELFLYSGRRAHILKDRHV